MDRLESYFDVTAARFPDRPALHIGSSTWSYADLLAAKSAVAKRLRREGLEGAQRPVGLFCDRSVWAYAGLLGIMASGNVYVPLSGRAPRERIVSLAQQAELAVVIVDADSRAMMDDAFQAADVKPSVVQVDDRSVTASGGISRSQLGAGRYAYLLFTSGTTGRPKGVGVTHANACTLIDGLAGELSTTSSDRFTQFADLAFDFSIGEIFMCWSGGGCLYVPSFAEVMKPVEFVNRHELTVWCSVPTRANVLKVVGALTPRALPSIRLSAFCGEALPTDLAKAWHEAAPASAIVNLYGPTEATVFATLYRFNPLAPTAEEIVPLGNPLPGIEYRIADVDDTGDGGPQSGELLLTGPQVVPGYWRNAAATKESFVRLPDDPQDRVWYRTGDLVSRSTKQDEGLIFRGRADDQVKLRGYRVQLREIEVVIRRVTHSDLVAVVPVLSKNGLCEDLVAYCNRTTDDEVEVKRRCGEYLPGYMLPRRIVALSSFPLNSSGKVDYVSLSTQAQALAQRERSSWTSSEKPER